MAVGDNDGDSGNAAGAITAAVSGTHFIRVTDDDGNDASYRFVAQVLDPQEGNPDTLETVDVMSGHGNDTFFVTPSPSCTININGDSPATTPAIC